MDRIVVVVGDDGDMVAKKLSETAADTRITFAEARTRRGSAEYALAGVDGFGDDYGDEDVIIVSGNTPLLTWDTVIGLVLAHREADAAATLLAVNERVDNSMRTVVAGRDAGTVDRLVSDSDSGFGTHGDGAPVWFASGVMVIRRSMLAPAIRRIRPDHESGQFQLAGIVEVLTEAGHRVVHHEAPDPNELLHVDDRVQLSAAEATIRARTNQGWMQRGVTMLDPSRTYVDTTVRLAPDVTLFPGTMLQGSTVVGAGAEIGPDTRLVDCAVGSGARVEKTMGRDAEVGEGAVVGPFAVLDPGSQVASASVTGPFYHASSVD